MDLGITQREGNKSNKMRKRPCSYMLVEDLPIEGKSIWWVEMNNTFYDNTFTHENRDNNVILL